MQRWGVTLRRRFHISWIIALASVGFIAGVILAQHTSTNIFSSIQWLVIAGCFVGVGAWKRTIPSVALLIIGVIVFGLWRGTVSVNQLKAIDVYDGRQVILSGIVKDDVDTDLSGQLVINLGQIRINDIQFAGTIRINSTPNANIKRSDTIKVNGKVAPGFGSYIATMYRAKIVSIERSEPGDVARQFRDWFAELIRNGIPEPQASLGIGYLVGQKRALPTDIADALKTVGLTHVVVASGYNLTILVRLARRLFMKVSKYTAALAASLLIICFVAITGLSPSMSRAGLVATLSLAAWYYGRRFHPLVLLPFVAAVTVLANPSYVAGDIGWELSFAAFGGVMVLAPLLQRYFFGEKKPGIVRQILGETTAALIVTAPILIGTFGQFSNVALIANLLVLPLVPLAMLLTFITGIGAFILPMYAHVIALPASWLLGYMVQVAKNLSQLSWATASITVEPAIVAASYLVIIGLCVYLWRITMLDLRDANIVV
jgi:competence protein ComEC